MTADSTAHTWEGETIAAISTPFGEGAIALVRMSGPRAVEIAAEVFQPKRSHATLPAGRPLYGTLRDGERAVDDVLLTVFRQPGSYTGEDVVEIACHGGVLLTRQVLELLLRRGARAAEPGEFTQRAFLHGKMDLTQAEAVMDLIHAQSELALEAAREQLAGRLGERMHGLRERLLTTLAHLEAFIDFPEEDIAPDSQDALLSRLAETQADVATLLATAGRGRWLREGVRTVIYGEPNVGKSSLLNVLLGYERAIVSATPGTTRDSIEEVIKVRGIPLRLVDTAGVREAADAVEQEGIARTRQQVERADLVLRIFSAEATPPATVEIQARELLVLNKVDLGEHPGWSGHEAVRISCVQARGLEQLETAIEQRVRGGSSTKREWSVAINARHQALLEQARGFIGAAEEGLRSRLAPEFVAEELRAALGAVGEIVGRVDTEEVLGEIFSTFCIGK